MTRSMNDATRKQIDAADPVRSTWVSANAGSGKTRVLTDRVARLLLNGVPPQNVLCLTYTKAAASEMQNRLFDRLGKWAMLEDDDLRGALLDLGVETPSGDDTLRQARRLFARAIETPGGLKIQTIHSFCAGLLRRFPLEAGVSPGFTELDEAATARLQSDVLDEIALSEPQIFADMAVMISDSDLTTLAARISARRTDFPAIADRDTVLALFGLPAGADAAQAYSELATLAAPDLLIQMTDVLCAQSKTMVALADDLSSVARDGLTESGFQRLDRRMLYASGQNVGTPKPSALTKKAREALGTLADDFDSLAEAVYSTRQRMLSLEAAEKTLVLHRFAAVFLPLYQRRKQEGGWLDFDDQIQIAERLLSQEGVAAWVLFRLDGSIDHVLVDEAQDTSPLQWAVIEHLTREFTSGEGTAEAGARSIFVVGDPKQSIYSFQGADPAGFSRMRRTFDDSLGHLGLSLQQVDLQYSFRSSGEVLRTVDVTFGPDNRQGLESAVEHIAFKDGLPGRVDLWPLIEPSEAEDPADWERPVDEAGATHHVKQLADRIATQCSEMVRNGFLWEEQDDHTYTPRPIDAGDILILVQGRGAGSTVSLFQEIIRACKAAGLEVAGADVLKLGEEIAVKDILSALAFLATPEDDLALAEILRSPVFGWDEAQLYTLAALRPKGQYLWQALRDHREAYPETFATLIDLRDNTDFLRPYDLIERLLVEHGGRKRLVARLGEEASDGIDALLAQALAYEQADIPSLTGFLARMEGAEVNVKRRAEGRGGKLRVMTVHGAKGLESPIVILPDTAHRRTPHEYKDLLLPSHDRTPQWTRPRAQSPAASEELKQAAIARREEEVQRLLYVAMTRAEQWLIVAAAGDLGSRGDCWYDQVRNGLTALGAQPIDLLVGEVSPVLRLESPEWAVTHRPSRTISPHSSDATVPDWAEAAAPTAAAPRAILSPSDLGGAKALPGENGGLSEEEAMRRGSRIHRLLEHLPSHSRATWAMQTRRLLDPETPPEQIPDLLSEACRVLDNESLGFLFTDSLAEVDITADLPDIGDARIHGTIDRLVVRDDTVLAVDFKTNAVVPTSAENVPDGLLRQMGAYASALEQIFPNKRIQTAILWTRTGELMDLPESLVHEAVKSVSPGPATP